MGKASQKALQIFYSGFTIFSTESGTLSHDEEGVRMYHFFAKLSRMKYICRWGLMRNTRPENLCEHSYETAVLAHALAVLRNERCGGHVDPQRAATLALFHDCTEILTGDLPTPVKYAGPALRSAYRTVENEAQEKLLSLLPADLAGHYRPLLTENSPADADLVPLVKAADKLSALVKCVEERAMGNTEFAKAEESTRALLEEMGLPEVEIFLREFLPSYSLTLDEQG